MKLRVLLLAVLICAGGVLFAQDEDGLYPDIPRSRADDGAFVLGDPDAPVTIIEFADFLCPHCQDYHTETVQPLIEEYVATGQAKFEYRFMPIIDQQVSPLLSAMNECAAEADLFWEGNDLLYELARDNEIGSEVVSDFAKQLDLELDPFRECLETATQFQTDFELGNELGVNGTPAVRVRVGDGEPGALEIEGQLYDRGGPPLLILGEFIESENPAELVRAVNQLRNDRLLASEDIFSVEEACSAPCWRGIVPGETTWEEALEIVEDDDQFENIEVQQAPDGDAARAAWSQAGGDPCCEMISQDGETVSFVRLLLAPDNDMSDLIDGFGEPTYLLGSESTRTQAFLTLFYPDVPMLAFVFVAGAEEGELTEDSEIIAVQYLTPADMKQLTDNNPLYEWDGFGSYAEYIDGEYDVTPEEQ